MTLAANYFESLTKGRTKKRVGRGIASGKGKTSGRGQKGQKSRTGVAIKGFEGGQMPIHRRLPKRGFVNVFRVEYQEINLSSIQSWVDSKKVKADTKITKELLVQLNVIKNINVPVKILAQGKITSALKIEADKASKAAVEAFQKAKGEIILPKDDNLAKPKSTNAKAAKQDKAKK